jgi:hypothetical protein
MREIYLVSMTIPAITANNGKVTACLNIKEKFYKDKYD